MADHNDLRRRLDSTNFYRKLKFLKNEIERSRGKIPFSIYADLLNRTEEKIRTLEYPICQMTKITVTFSNELNKEISTNECIAALADGNSLANYVFSRYPAATDYKMDSMELTGTLQKNYAEGPRKEESTVKFEPTPTKSNPDIQEEVRNLTERVDKMEKTMTEELPKINRKMDDLEVKMDYLYHFFMKDKDKEKKQ